MFVRLRAIGRHLLRAREWFPLTNLGIVVLLLAALAYWGFGVPRVDYVVQLVSALVMALVITALVAVLVGSILVFRATSPEDSAPLAFEAHRGFAEVFSLPSWWALPLFDVEWTWISPVGFRVEVVKRDGRRVERVETERRGRVDHIVRRLVIEDAFGLARVILHRPEWRPVTVVPWSGSLERAPVLRSLADGDALPHPRGAPVGDQVDMRQYVPGDPLKLAMWKVYARTRELMVRTPERAIAPSTQVAAYLPAATGDEPAAAAARVAVQSGLLGADWVLGADGSSIPADSVETATRYIVASRAHRDQPTGQAAGLAPFLERLGEGRNIKLVVFVPGRPGPWLERVLEVARRRPEHTSCVVVVDGIVDEPEDRARRWSRWFKRPAKPRDEDEACVTSEEFHDVVQSLARARIQITALDRVRGQVLNVGRSAQGVELARRVA